MRSSQTTLTPKEAISKLAYKLREGCSIYTGQQDASVSALIAFIEFRDYLYSLPEDIRKQIWNLKMDTSVKNIFISLGETFTDLLNINCIEIASGRFTIILNENLSNTILEYAHPSNTLANTENDNNPSPCLISLTIIKDEADNIKEINKHLKDLSKEHLSKVLNEKNFDGNTLLHIIARDKGSECLKAMLALIPNEQLAELIQIKNSKGDTVLHTIANKKEGSYDLVSLILSSLPIDKRLQAIIEKDNFGYPVLNNLTSNLTSEQLQDILNLLPKEARSQAIMTSNNFKNTILHVNSYHPDRLIVALSATDESERITVTLQKNSEEQTFLHILSTRRDERNYIPTLLSLIPRKERLIAITHEDGKGNTVLHQIANSLYFDPDNINLLQETLKTLPPEDRWDAVNKEYGSERSVLSIVKSAIKDPKQLESLLEAIPDNSKHVSYNSSESGINKSSYPPSFIESMQQSKIEAKSASEAKNGHKEPKNNLTIKSFVLPRKPKG